MKEYSAQVINAAFEWIRLDTQYMQAVQAGEEQEARQRKQQREAVGRDWESRYGDNWSRLVSQIRQQLRQLQIAA